MILLEDFAALIGSGVRAVRGRDDAAHPERHLRRDRHRHDRPAAGRWSPSPSRSRPRACCSASRPARRPSAGSRRALTGTPGVDRIIHMKTMHLGPEEILVAAKIGVRGTRERRGRSRRRDQSRRGEHPRGRADGHLALSRAGHLRRRLRAGTRDPTAPAPPATDPWAVCSRKSRLRPPTSSSAREGKSAFGSPSSARRSRRFPAQAS